jgi:NAD(P)H-dependent flavin oxidoreductase YrpB (nitropropane dioxygenase family)
MTGGIANAAGFVAALALGAEGVIIGTRFLMAAECPLHPRVRKMLSESMEDDTVLVSVVTKRPARRIRNATVDEIIKLEAENAPAEKISELMSGARMLEAVTKGDVNGGSLGCGQAIGLINKVMSSRQIITEIIAESKTIIDRLVTECGTFNS